MRLVTADGQVVLAPTLVEVAWRAAQAPDKKNFIFKVGTKSVGKPASTAVHRQQSPLRRGDSVIRQPVVPDGTNVQRNVKKRRAAAVHERVVDLGDDPIRLDGRIANRRCEPQVRDLSEVPLPLVQRVPRPPAWRTTHSLRTGVVAGVQGREIVGNVALDECEPLVSHAVTGYSQLESVGARSASAAQPGAGGGALVAGGG